MKNIFYPFAIAAFSLSTIQLKAQTNIDVVFHVVYKTAAQNIPDSCLQQQLDVLNEDFNAANSDLWKVPTAWVPIIGNMNVHFQLATIDPSGNPTTGIERHQTVTTSWTTNDQVKYNSSGGLDAWPDTSYLNIWVCNLAGGLLGYAQFPSGAAATDGVVLQYNVTGRGTYAISPFNLGRTGTHEVAHWFGVKNFAPSTSCSSDDDNILDTPTYMDQLINGSYHPFQVVTDACNPSTPGIMWMNFMTFMYDSSMYFFTQNQVDTMTWVMNNRRVGNSTTTSIKNSFNKNNAATIYPSPSSDGHFTIKNIFSESETTIAVYDLTGKLVAGPKIISVNENETSLDLSFLESGTYTVTIFSEQEKQTLRVSIVR